MRLRAFLGMWLLSVSLLGLWSCSTKPSVPQPPQVILPVLPNDWTTPCVIFPVEEDTVKALAKGYVLNTGAAGCANNKLHFIQQWYKDLEAQYGSRTQ